MGSYHWVFSSFDNVEWAGDTVLPTLTNAIPETATMHRFIAKGFSVTGFSRGVGGAWVTPLFMTQEVKILDYPYANRIIYSARQHIPVEVQQRNDTFSVIDEFTQWVMGGDQDLSFNRKCAFGKRDGPGFGVRLTMHIISPGSELIQPVGRVTAQFHTLYRLP